jgi:hypothetical protein
LVGAPGFEPGTSCAQGRRATRLRYAPTVKCLFIIKHFQLQCSLKPCNLVSTLPELARILSLNHGCARIHAGVQRHFVCPLVDFLQSLSFHLQRHLRILFEDVASRPVEATGSPTRRRLRLRLGALHASSAGRRSESWALICL